MLYVVVRSATSALFLLDLKAGNFCELIEGGTQIGSECMKSFSP